MINFGVIQGYVTKDPEITYSLGDGKPTVKFCLSSEDDFKPKGKVRYNLANFVAYGRLGENVMKCLKKGQTVIVQYSKHTANYYSPDGKKRAITSDVVTAVRFDRLRDPLNMDIASKRDNVELCHEASEYDGFDEDGFFGRTPINGK